MLNGLLLTLNIIVCILLIIVVLMQRSEGGALGQGGGPTGLVTARGAGDLLTRTTWILFTLFLALSLAQTIVGGRERSSLGFVNGLKGTTINLNAAAPPVAGATPGQTAPGQAAPAGPAPPLALSAPRPTVSLPTAATPTHARAAAPIHATAAPRPEAAPSPGLVAPSFNGGQPLELGAPKPSVAPAPAPASDKPPSL